VTKARLAAVALLALICAAAGAGEPAASASTGGYSHVVVVIDENYDNAEVLSNAAAPYITSLAAQGETFPNDHAVTHPSEGNYLALLSGSVQGTNWSDNCITSTSRSVVGEALAAGVSVEGYIEGLSSGNDYLCRHNPFSQFTDAISAQTDFSNFPTDYSTLPQISFVIPNSVDDMHDAGIAPGDTWLQANLDGYIQWAKTHNSLFILTSDENEADPNYFQNPPGEAGNNVMAVFVGAGITPGAVDDRNFDHYSLLRTLEDLFGLGDLGWSPGAIDMLSTASAPPAPVDLAPPTISGTPIEGQTLSEIHGSWSASPTAYAYEWERCDITGSNCQAITRATGQSYTLLAADLGSTIRVLETGSNASGGGSPATSSATAAVRPAPADPAVLKTLLVNEQVSSRNRSAAFRLEATGTSTGFQCALVRVPTSKGAKTPSPKYSSCGPWKRYRHLRLGRYVVYARAVGPGGVDETPATRHFRIT